MREKIYTTVYKNMCEQNGFIQKIYEKTYAVLVKINDPIISYKINGFDCKMNFSHKGAYYMMRNPLYDKQLGLICKLLKDKVEHSLNIVDVGANIGDTVLNIGDKENYYLCIEGVHAYASLLKQNLAGFDYKLVERFVDEKEIDDIKIVKNNGTARIIQDVSGKSLQKTSTVDSICEKMKIIPDVIKVDTDGFDFKVLRGTEYTIHKYKPIIFFEWTLPELLDNGEDPVSIFGLMNKEGYEKGILFDNLGNPFCIIETNKSDNLLRLVQYTKTKRIGYYDVCLIHKEHVINIEEIWNALFK